MYIGLKNIVSSQNRLNKKKEVKKEEIVIAIFHNLFEKAKIVER